MLTRDTAECETALNTEPEYSDKAQPVCGEGCYLGVSGRLLTALVTHHRYISSLVYVTSSRSSSRV
jgi:hypothetical protein